MEVGDSLMLVPGKQALLLCMSVITKWKPVLTLMKKSEVVVFHEAFVFAKAGGARFQYTLLKFSCPRRSAFSTTPLSVVTTWTYLRAFRGGGAGLRFRWGEGGGGGSWEEASILARFEALALMEGGSECNDAKEDEGTEALRAVHRLAMEGRSSEYTRCRSFSVE